MCRPSDVKVAVPQNWRKYRPWERLIQLNLQIIMTIRTSIQSFFYLLLIFKHLQVKNCWNWLGYYQGSECCLPFVALCFFKIHPHVSATLSVSASESQQLKATPKYLPTIKYCLKPSQSVLNSKNLPYVRLWPHISRCFVRKENCVIPLVTYHAYLPARWRTT